MKETETFLASNGNIYTFSKWKLLDGEIEKPIIVQWMLAGKTFSTLEEAITYRKKLFKNKNLWRKRK